MTKAKFLYFLINVLSKTAVVLLFAAFIIGCQPKKTPPPDKQISDQHVVVEYSMQDLKENLQGLWQEPSSGLVFKFESSWDEIKKTETFTFQSPGFFDEYAIPLPPMTEVRFELQDNVLLAHVGNNDQASLKVVRAKEDGITILVDVHSGDRLQTTLKLVQVETHQAMELVRKQSHLASIRWVRINAKTESEKCELGDHRGISFAIHAHNFECVKKLIAKVPNSPQFRSLKNQWYLDAVAELDVGIAELVLESGADMNAFDDEGRNAMQILMLSAKNLKFNFSNRKIWLDYRPMLLLLTQMGVDYNEADLTGVSTFHRLLLSEDNYVGDLVKMMIVNGAQFEISRSRDQFMYEKFFIGYEQRFGAERHFILEKVLENISITKRLTRKSYFTFLKTAAIFGDQQSFEIFEQQQMLNDNNLMVMMSSLKEEIFARENEMPVQLNNRQLRHDYLKNLERLKNNQTWLESFANKKHPSQIETN